MVKRILALSLLMVGLVACGGQEDPAGEPAEYEIINDPKNYCRPDLNAATVTSKGWWIPCYENVGATSI